MTNHVDVLGRELHIGDVVAIAAAHRTSAKIVVGRIDEFAPSGVKATKFTESPRRYVVNSSATYRTCENFVRLELSEDQVGELVAASQPG